MLNCRRNNHDAQTDDRHNKLSADDRGLLDRLFNDFQLHVKQKTTTNTNIIITWPDGHKMVCRRKKRSILVKTTAEELPNEVLISQYMPHMFLPLTGFPL